MFTKSQLPEPDVEYPDSDGEPISDNTLQFKWITTLTYGVSTLFKDNPNVFVAGDLLWYPVQGEPQTRIGPDAMVVFGRPKGERDSYRQWVEGDIAPQVVFEVLSPGNRAGELKRKFEFYDRFGVEEYYIWDPDNVSVEIYTRKNGRLQSVSDINSFKSPRTSIRFELTENDMIVHTPDGHRFLHYLEVIEERNSAYRDAELERLAKQQAQRSADATEKLLETEQRRAERFAAELKRLGIDPSTLE